MTKTFVACGVVALATLGFAVAPSRSSAGFVGVPESQCRWNAGGTTGYCAGTFRGFRQGGNANDRANFYLNHSGAGSFYAMYNGVTYACSFSASQAMATFVSAAGQNLDQYFVLSFDNSGACTYGYLYQGSSYTGT